MAPVDIPPVETKSIITEVENKWSGIRNAPKISQMYIYICINISILTSNLLRFFFTGVLST
jgi:hypothetical protein